MRPIRWMLSLLIVGLVAYGPTSVQSLGFGSYTFGFGYLPAWFRHAPRWYFSKTNSSTSAVATNTVEPVMSKPNSSGTGISTDTITTTQSPRKPGEMANLIGVELSRTNTRQKKELDLNQTDTKGRTDQEVDATKEVRESLGLLVSDSSVPLSEEESELIVSRVLPGLAELSDEITTTASVLATDQPNESAAVVTQSPELVTQAAEMADTTAESKSTSRKQPKLDSVWLEEEEALISPPKQPVYKFERTTQLAELIATEAPVVVKLLFQPTVAFPQEVLSNTPKPSVEILAEQQDLRTESPLYVLASEEAERPIVAVTEQEKTDTTTLPLLEQFANFTEANLVQLVTETGQQITQREVVTSEWTNSNKPREEVEESGRVALQGDIGTSSSLLLSSASSTESTVEMVTMIVPELTTEKAEILTVAAPTTVKPTSRKMATSKMLADFASDSDFVSSLHNTYYSNSVELFQNMNHQHAPLESERSFELNLVQAQYPNLVASQDFHHKMSQQFASQLYQQRKK